MSLLQLRDLHLVLFLSFLEFHIIVLIEVLILLNVSLLNLLLLLLMAKHELLELHVELLLLQFLNSVFCHFSLNITAFLFARSPVLLHSRNEVLDILLVHLCVLATILTGILLFRLLLHLVGSINENNNGRNKQKA